MDVGLSDTERQLLRQAQRACRNKAGYVPVTVLLLLDKGRSVAVIAEDLCLDEATVYCYAQTYRLKGLTGYLAGEQLGYWGLLTSAQLAGLAQEVGPLYRLPRHCRLAAGHLRHPLFDFGSDGLAAPAGLLL